VRETKEREGKSRESERENAMEVIEGEKKLRQYVYKIICPQPVALQGFMLLVI